MITLPAPPAQGPLLSLAVLHRSLSQQRLDAYRQASDRDEADPLARYLWSMALASALHPTLHVFEITLRNAIYATSVKLIDCSRLHMPDVPCWLDARNSTLLYAKEAGEVERAKTYLGAEPRRRTPGHLIAKLTFGFWVQLTARVYSEHRADGPRLWPRGLPSVFPYRWPPGSRKLAPDHGDREMVYKRLHEVRELRNRIAHHAPVWDRDLATEYARILEVLGWMSTRVAQSVQALDTFPCVLAAGPAAYRQQAERLLLGPGGGAARPA
ncbi:MAG TPA: hypothetical protein VK358_16240 [Longimicrobium sp.]|nr:hypothetical protein [Longimicrobium sp.]